MIGFIPYRDWMKHRYTYYKDMVMVDFDRANQIVKYRRINRREATMSKKSVAAEAAEILRDALEVKNPIVLRAIIEAAIELLEKRPNGNVKSVPIFPPPPE